jgi:hypothetical protein
MPRWLRLPTVVLARSIIVALMAALIFEVLFCRWLATKWKPTSITITIAAGIAALIGPACGLLPYTDYMPLFLNDLAFVWVTAAIGVVSIGIGAFAISIGSKVAGTICVVTNIPVLLYWGFVGAFFSMGGSR